MGRERPSARSRRAAVPAVGSGWITAHCSGRGLARLREHHGDCADDRVRLGELY